jgi:DNA (cytosine-5)-methyltransferase 3A
MKVLSLFDWISCARIALERLGIKVDEYYASEVDKYAMQVSQKNYPDIIQIGNVKQVEYEFLRGSKDSTGYYLLWEPSEKLLKDTMRKTDIDLLIWGSPCQDLSIAKKNRKGLDWERSWLFRDYVRILKQVKPKYFVLENVASMSKESKDIISKELWVEPIMINAALVSWQVRKKLFRTNIPNIELPEDKGILLKDILENWEADRLKSYCIDASYYKWASREHYKKKGNRQLIKVGQFNGGGQGDRVHSTEWKSVTLSANGGWRGAKTGLYVIPEYSSYNYYNDKIVPNNKAKTLGTNPQSITAIAGQLVNDGFAIRKLTPIECERLQGVPDNYTEWVSNAQRYKTLGNAFNVDVVAHILSFIPK